MNNMLIQGDNLLTLKYLYKNGYEGKIDLIYIDLPFNTGRKDLPYNDSWKSTDDYLNFLRPRLFWMRELLSENGSIYVHLDHHVGHYAKILMDEIFGDKNFVNEIVWCYSNSGRSEKFFSKKHDSIFLYRKTQNAFWNKEFKIPYSESYIKSHFTDFDENNRQCRKRLDAGKWRIYYPEEGMIPNDWWTDIASLNSMAKERIGYPTQKPEALLERIIKASSNPGDVVADFFAGSGTTGAVAEKLGRRWIMCDSNPKAIEVIKQRMKDCFFYYFEIGKEKK